MRRYEYEYGGIRCIIFGAQSAAGALIGEFLTESGAKLYQINPDQGPKAPTPPAATGRATVGDTAVPEGRVEQWAPLVDEAAFALGGIDCLVCCYDFEKLRRAIGRDDLDAARWSWLLGDWLVNYFAVSRAVIPHMVANRGGRIVFITSTAGYTGDFGEQLAREASIHECACSSGITGMMTSMARELIPRGISVNAIAVNPDMQLDQDRLIWAVDLWLSGRCDYACGRIIRLE